MGNFKQYLEKKGHSHKSIAGHYHTLCRFIGWCESENIESDQATYGELLAYVKYLQNRKVKQRTVQLYINTLSHYFTWRVKQGEREENPARHMNIKGIQRNHLYHIIPKVELESLYEKYPIPEESSKDKNQNWFKASVLTAKRNKAMTGLMVWQGLTTSELQNLTLRDLKLREGKIYIAGTRRSNERELVLESAQILDLMEYTLQVRPELAALTGTESDRLFISNGKGAGNLHNTISKLMVKLKELHRGLSSLQQIRASVIVHWLKNHNLREVQYRAGHRYISSTENYLLNDLEGLSDEINKFHPIG